MGVGFCLTPKPNKGAKMKMKEVTIDGKKYSFGYWDVDTSTEYLTKLIKLLGEPLAMILLGAVDKKEEGQSLMDIDTSQIKGDAIAAAFKGLASRLSEDEVKQIMRQCANGVLCDGKKIDYNSHFMGKIGHLFRVALANLKHQYSDFLGAGLGLGE